MICLQRSVFNSNTENQGTKTVQNWFEYVIFMFRICQYWKSIWSVTGIKAGSIMTLLTLFWCLYCKTCCQYNSVFLSNTQKYGTDCNFVCFQSQFFWENSKSLDIQCFIFSYTCVTYKDFRGPDFKSSHYLYSDTTKEQLVEIQSFLTVLLSAYFDDFNHLKYFQRQCD